MSFIEDLIMLNAKDYLGTVSDLYINIVVFAIAALLCAASFVFNHRKAYNHKIIRQLLRRSATSEEEAKTLKELHLENSRYLKAALMKKGQLTSVVKRAGYSEPTYEEYVSNMKAKRHKEQKPDFDAERFYIPADKVDTAKRIQERGEPTVLRTVFICVLIFALSVCTALLMPEILRLLSKASEKI